jgi:putative Flp pilus-assembly TadE/G-like protein
MPLPRLQPLSRTSLLSEGAQTLPLVVLFMTGLLGVSALVLDLGNMFQQRQAVQAAADSAALAGATQLAAGWSAAQTAATQNYAKNGRVADTVVVAQTTDLAPGDSVTVTATRAAPTFFARIFGISSGTVTATARATIESYTSYTSTGNVLPFGVMKGNYTLGQSYTIYGDGSSSNNGALSLDLSSGGGCSSANGASDLRDTIDGSSLACPVAVGDDVPTKPGNNTGPVAQGLNSRITTWKPFNQIVQVNGNGQYTLLDPSSPQLVLVPVVLNTNGNATWPNGSSQVQIVGFAWFVITGCGNPSIQGSCTNSDGKYVNGTFVGLMDSGTSGTTGAYDPQSGSAAAVRLTQ